MTDLLEHPKYARMAAEVSEIFRDNPIDPMESAMFHIEYVMRHRGADYLKSAATNLTWYEHLLLDIAALFLAATFAIILMIRLLLRSLMRLCSSRQGKEKTS